MKFTLYLILCIPLLHFCVSSPKLHVEKSLKTAIEDTTFAVINFDYNGAQLSSANANNAADQFASEFYIQMKAKVVDRNIVRELLRKMELSSAKRLSSAQIQKIASDLNARYLIFGTLVSLRTMEEYYDDNKVEIKLTIRIIDSMTGEVVAMVQNQKSSKENVNILIQSLVNDAIFFLNREV
ncbi:MAG: hypothetical protein JW956_09470 [Calditrichaceae bacterium]|nr:hypothetical protein [Calditrichaceae bacterium]